ncbi:glycosyltransferase family 39 protein [candidate division KSB1 bacterium]|nr:glycosyltransferase family 39 protein [candidate division KSB1 bacterium]
MNRKNYYYLCFFLALALLLRLGLLLITWLNPDEGAHLMDGRLILDGYIPIVDYEARQPFYVFMLAVVLKIFGASFIYGRLLPVMASLGTGLILFYIGRRLFNDAVGLVACAIYLFLPFLLMWSVVVKTEPLTILLASASILFMLKSYNISIENLGWMVFSGMFAALAYYVRASAFLIPTIIVLFLLFRYDTKPKKNGPRLFLFALGYLVVCILAGTVFLSSMSFRDILISQVNPLDTIYDHVAHFITKLWIQGKSVEGSGFRVLDQNFSYTKASWYQGVVFSLFVFVGGILAFLHFLSHRLKHRINTYLLLAIWTGFILFPYIYQTFYRGFFPQYITEALPPLILLTASTGHRLMLKTSLGKRRILTVIGVFGLLFILQKAFWQYYPGFTWTLIIAALLCGVVLYRKAVNFYSLCYIVVAAVLSGILNHYLEGIGVNRLLCVGCTLLMYSTILLCNSILKWKKVLLKSSSVVLLTAFYITAIYSGSLIGPRYVGVWSPKVVYQIKKILEEHGERADTVLSGGMIWTFESGRYPFLNVSHPTQFLLKEWPDFEIQFENNKPDFIIKESYTEKKFSYFWEFLESQIDSSYSLVKSVPAPPGTVDIYKLNDPFSTIDVQ